MYSRIEQDQKTVATSETFLSNDEVDALVENFRITIENMTLEYETVKPKLEEQKIKLENLKIQKEQLNNELSEFKHKIEFYQPQINELLNNQKGYYSKNPKINQIYHRYILDDTKSKSEKNNYANFEKAIKSEPNIVFHEEENVKEIFSHDKEYECVDKIIKQNDNKLTQQEKNTLQSALSMYISESELEVKNQNKFSRLFTESLNNREQVLKKEAKLLIIQYCIHCKQRFSPLCNEEGSCIFHMGKLKFYSCKSCGCDEYYNCCGKCLKCCKGCAVGKHAAKEKVFRNETTPQSKPKAQSMNNITDSDFYQISFESVQFLNKKI